MSYMGSFLPVNLQLLLFPGRAFLGDVLPMVQGMDFSYRPQLGDLPTLNLPEVGRW